MHNSMLYRYKLLYAYYIITIMCEHYIYIIYVYITYYIINI